MIENICEKCGKKSSPKDLQIVREYSYFAMPNEHSLCPKCFKKWKEYDIQ